MAFDGRFDIADTEIPAQSTTYLTWDYTSSLSTVEHLYNQAKLGQWNAATDIDWSIPVDFGSPLPRGSDYEESARRASPLASRGMEEWSRFRWESQSYMVSQFLHGEQVALAATARLVQELPTIDGKQFAAMQVADEARHVEAFARYLREQVANPYSISPSLSELLQGTLRAESWDIVALGVHVIIEPIALATFRLGGWAFHDDLIRQILTRVARDEARHMSFGVLLLPDVLAELTDSEWRDREELVLESASLMRRRFSLLEVWERMEVRSGEGIQFVAMSPMMSGFNRATFSKVVGALARIGLLTNRVRDGLSKLDLLSDSASRSIVNRPVSARPKVQS